MVVVKKITKRKKGTNIFLKSNLKIGKKDIGLINLLAMVFV